MFTQMNLIVTSEVFLFSIFVFVFKSIFFPAWTNSPFSAVPLFHEISLPPFFKIPEYLEDYHWKGVLSRNVSELSDSCLYECLNVLFSCLETNSK